MYDLILPILCIIQLGIPPYPTPEINKTIDKMGSVKFAERESATREIEKIGYLALKGLEIASKTHPDMEVRERSEKLIKKYTYINLQNFPYIYGLPEENSNGLSSITLKNKKNIVFPDGTAKRYFFVAQGSKKEDWNTYAFQIATQLLASDLLWHGWTKAEVLEILDQIDKNTSTVSWNDIFNR